MQKTGIEYLTHTWNPIAMRCTVVSEGCRNCWHIRMADRLARNKAIKEAERKSYEGGFFTLREKELMAPLAAGSRKVIGVQFMGDLFHPQICFGETGWIDSILTIAALCQEHKFILLTKRPDNMAGYLEKDALAVDRVSREVERLSAEHGWCSELEDWPLPNVWHGLTVCNQEEADAKIPVFLKVPGKKFLSIEPMLGPINFTHDTEIGPLSFLKRYNIMDDKLTERIDAVILGGETGAGARPLHPDWVRSVRDQCQAVGVPFMFKQWGEWQPVEPLHDEWPTCGRAFWSENSVPERKIHDWDDYRYSLRIGKKDAGRILDGRTHDDLAWVKGCPSS